MTTIGHNSAASQGLRQYVERVEELDLRKQEISDDRKLVLAEAKANGFDTKGINYVVKARKLKPSEFEDMEALRETYLHALGMLPEAPLHRHVSRFAADITSREAVIEVMKKFVPTDGSITVEAGGKQVKLTRHKSGEVVATDVEAPRPVITPDAPPAPTNFNSRREPPPACSTDEAEAMGREAHKSDVPIIKNPFPFGDERRARWDKGWREDAGNDGMGPDD